LINISENLQPIKICIDIIRIGLASEESISIKFDYKENQMAKSGKDKNKPFFTL
jgi:hypothetical protein